MKLGYFQAPTATSGTYHATLKTVNAYTGTKYQSDRLEPILQLVWEIETDSGVMNMTDLVRIPRDEQGMPQVVDQSKLLNRVCGLFGAPLTPEELFNIGFSIELPEEYDNPEMLEALPHWSDRKGEGFTPVKVKAVMVGDQDMIGRQAQITLVEKGDRIVVESCFPLPKRGAAKAKPPMPF